MLTAKYQTEAANTSQTAENQSNDKNKSAIYLNMNNFGSTTQNCLMMLNSGRLGIRKVDALKRKSIKKAEMLFGKNDAKGLEILAKRIRKN